MSSDVINQSIYTVIYILVAVLVILAIVGFVIWNKNRTVTSKPSNIKSKSTDKKGTADASAKTSYNIESIMNFMEFEKIEDNMIIQKKHKRFLMVVECQGINYDLMSKMEKVSVEEGFQQFLNTLKHPIQIYIQTRTVNLGNSISGYKKRVEEIKDRYNKTQFEYERLLQNDNATRDQINRKLMELTKVKNLAEYGQDIIVNTERMSLNKNVLNKKYYVIIPYLSADDEKYSKEEVRNIAFSELYTKSQSIARTLGSCGVSGKILNSEELVELLYVSYNRDESEIFSIEKAMRAGYDELYSTAPNVLERKMDLLDEQILEKAAERANQMIAKAKPRVVEEIKDRERNMDTWIDNMAEMIINENADVIGDELADAAIKEIKEEKVRKKTKAQEGGNVDEKAKKTTRKSVSSK